MTDSPSTSNITNNENDPWDALASDAKTQADRDAVAADAFATADMLYNTIWRVRRDKDLNNIQFYESDPAGMGYTDASPSVTTPLTSNLLLSIINTLAAEVAYVKPKAQFTTDMAEWTVQRKAKRMEQCVDAEFQKNRAYELALDAFYDGCKTGLGTVKVSSNADGYPQLQRIHSMEILVDPAETNLNQNNPGILYHYRPIAKSELIRIYGQNNKKLSKKEQEEILAAIDSAESTPYEKDFYRFILPQARTYLQDTVMVCEGWKLPSGRKTKDGWHVVCIAGKCLLLEPYERLRFPFAHWRWSKSTFGFYGRSVIDETKKHQDEYNRVSAQIALNMNATQDPVYWVPDEYVAKKFENGRPGDILYPKNPNGNGRPELLVFKGSVDELARERDKIIERAFNQVGLTLQRAVADVPARVETGASIREFLDSGSKVQHPKIETYEQFFMDMAAILIDEKNDLAKRGIDPDNKVVELRGSRKRLSKSFKWKEICLDDDRYQIEYMPGSLLPSTPVGRTKAVEGMINSGLIPKDAGLSLLGIPDINQYTSIASSQWDLVLYQVEVMIEDGIYVFPDPTQNLTQARQLVANCKAKFQLENVPEEHLDLLMRFMDDCDYLLKKAADYQAAQAQGPQQLQPGTEQPLQP